MTSGAATIVSYSSRMVVSEVKNVGRILCSGVVTRDWSALKCRPDSDGKDHPLLQHHPRPDNLVSRGNTIQVRVYIVESAIPFSVVMSQAVEITT